MLFNKLGFSFMWDSLNRKAKRDILNKLVSQIEITRDKNYNIEIKNIKFTDEFISRSCKEYLEYLNDILKNNNIGIKYQELITTDELNNYSKNYYVLSLQKLEKNEYSNDETLRARCHRARGRVAVLASAVHVWLDQSANPALARGRAGEMV